MRTFLMISPHYPPSGAVAAKRALCFSRRTPEWGWTPAVIALPDSAQRDPGLTSLTPQVPLYRRYRGGPVAWLEDRVLSRPQAQRSVTHPSAVGGGALERARRSWLHELKGLPFDRFTKYIPTLIPGALTFLRRHHCELIYATGGPFSSFILGHTLSKVTGLPLVLDLRDPYTVDPIYTGRWSRLGYKVARGLEERQFARAQRVILNTRTAHDVYVESYRGLLEPERFTYIRNHFDPELYDAELSPRLLSRLDSLSSETFKVIFFGHLTPIRDASLFLRALREVIDARSLSPAQIKFYTLRDRTQVDMSLIDELELTPYIDELNWAPFTQARALLKGFDLLLDLTSERHYMRISGKLYDYLASERPILCISESEELTEIMRETGAGEVVPNRLSEVSAALLRAYDARGAAQGLGSRRGALEQFSARPAARQLAEIFDQSVS